MWSTETNHRTGRPFDPDDSIYSISGVSFQDYLHFSSSAVLCLARYNGQQLLSGSALSGYSVKWKLCFLWGRNCMFVYYHPNFRFEMVMLRQFIDFIMPFFGYVLFGDTISMQCTLAWEMRWYVILLERKVQEWAMFYWTRCTIICLEKLEEVSNKQNNPPFSKQLIRCVTDIL